MAFTLLPVPLGAQQILSDKTWHFLAFGGLTSLGLFAWDRRSWPMVIMASVALGAVIEVLQATPWIGRDAEISDFIADVVGTGTAIPVRSWLRAIKRQ